MPQSTNPEALAVLAKYQDRYVLVKTALGVCLHGRFKALEYDRSMILMDVRQYLRTSEPEFEESPTAAQHRGWVSFRRRSMLIPGKQITQVLLAEGEEDSVEGE